MLLWAPGCVPLHTDGQDPSPPRHGQSCHVATGSRLRRQELGFYCNNSPNLVKGQQFISSLSLPRKEEFSTLCSSTMRFMADCAKSCSRELDCLLMLPAGLGQPSCLSTRGSEGDESPHWARACWICFPAPPGPPGAQDHRCFHTEHRQPGPERLCNTPEERASLCVPTLEQDARTGRDLASDSSTRTQTTNPCR